MDNLPIKGISNGWAPSQSLYRDLSGRMSKQILNLNNSQDTDILKHAIDATEGRCFYCGRKLYVRKNNTYEFIKGTTIEHLIPVSKWGLFATGNIVVACTDCNSKRNNKPFLTFYREMHNANKPTLYDTEEEFEAALDKIQEPYKQEFPQLFEMGMKFLNNEVSNEHVSVLVSYDDKGITHEVKLPLSSKGVVTSKQHTDSDNNKSITESSADIQELMKHVMKMCPATKQENRKSFERSLNSVIGIFASMGFNSVSQLRVVTPTAIRSIEKKIKKTKNISLSKSLLVMSYIGIALQNDNFHINNGLMPSLIERMGTNFILK